MRTFSNWDEHGNNKPSRVLVQFYDEQFDGDGLARRRAEPRQRGVDGGLISAGVEQRRNLRSPTVDDDDVHSFTP